MGLVKTKPTADVIRSMATELQATSKRLERLADELEQKDDWDTVSEAVSLLTGMIPNLRLDLLTARPIREYQYALAAAGASKT